MRGFGQWTPGLKQREQSGEIDSAYLTGWLIVLIWSLRKRT